MKRKMQKRRDALTRIVKRYNCPKRFLSWNILHNVERLERLTGDSYTETFDKRHKE